MAPPIRSRVPRFRFYLVLHGKPCLETEMMHMEANMDSDDTFENSSQKVPQSGPIALCEGLRTC